MSIIYKQVGEAIADLEVASENVADAERQVVDAMLERERAREAVSAARSALKVIIGREIEAARSTFPPAPDVADAAPPG